MLHSINKNTEKSNDEKIIMIGDIFKKISDRFYYLVAKRMRNNGFENFRSVEIDICVSIINHEEIILTNLCAEQGITMQATGKKCKVLERQGFLRFERNKHDGRQQNISFTEQGQKLADKLKESMQLANHYTANNQVSLSELHALFKSISLISEL